MRQKLLEESGRSISRFVWIGNYGLKSAFCIAEVPKYALAEDYESSDITVQKYQ